jgi:hypothetical protein
MRFRFQILARSEVTGHRGEQMRSNAKRWLVTFTMACAVIEVVAFGVTTLVTASAAPHIRIVYFVPVSVSTTEELPGFSSVLQGMSLVHDSSTLKRVVEQVIPDALILHEGSMRYLDESWLIGQYQRGVIIVGINMKMYQLADLVNEPNVIDAHKTDDWYRKPFYSYVGHRPTINPAAPEALPTARSSPERSKTEATHDFAAGVVRNVTDAKSLLSELDWAIGTLKSNP